MFDNEFIELLQSYLTDPEYATITGRGSNWLRVRLPDGSVFRIKVEREEAWL